MSCRGGVGQLLPSTAAARSLSVRHLTAANMHRPRVTGDTNKRTRRLLDDDREYPYEVATSLTGVALAHHAMMSWQAAVRAGIREPVANDPRIQ